jgi:hypothetical protein
MTRATVDGLRRLVRPEDVAQLRGKTIAQVLPVSRAAPRASEEEQPVRAAAAEAAKAESAEAEPAATEPAEETEE